MDQETAMLQTQNTGMGAAGKRPRQYNPDDYEDDSSGDDPNTVNIDEYLDGFKGIRGDNIRKLKIAKAYTAMLRAITGKK